MHIPDGYLSPSTCVVLYAGATPFWLVALRRVRQTMNARFVPLLSLAAAFSFVLMMFNLPLPGGTTGHAVGIGVTSVVLGPWASVIAVSVALLIQAVFFGDGGITAYGANCLNMAIVGSLTAHFLYHWIAHGSAVDSRRRILAAGIAGYLAINLSAFCAAIEFGIQPWLFHDVSGTPLYAPYPLQIAVPAMLLGHLSFAGFAEAMISGSVVAYLQKANPALLQTSAGLQGPGVDGRSARSLWLGLAVLLICTPLGLLAGGTAWGEWSPEDFKDPRAREQIASASAHLAPPGEVPKGLQALSDLWTAPFPDYAPRFLKSKELGYILSAMFGTGMIILLFFLYRIFWPLRPRTSTPSHR